MAALSQLNLTRKMVKGIPLKTVKASPESRNGGTRHQSPLFTKIEPFKIVLPHFTSDSQSRAAGAFRKGLHEKAW